jgi:Flp pilus assembly protein TadG
MALPLVVLLMLLVAQVGMVVHDQVLVTHAAREAARAASVQPGSDLGAITGAATAAGPLDRARLDVEVTHVDGPVPTVRVRVRYRCRTDMVLIGALVPDLTLEASAAMRHE